MEVVPSNPAGRELFRRLSSGGLPEPVCLVYGEEVFLVEQAVKAIVVAKQGEELTETELIEWARGEIGRFKIPKKVVFTDSIPRTPTGKILKRLLREEFN